MMKIICQKGIDKVMDLKGGTKEGEITKDAAVDVGGFYAVVGKSAVKGMFFVGNFYFSAAVSCWKKCMLGQIACTNKGQL